MTVLLYLGDFKLDSMSLLDLPTTRSWSYAEHKTIEGLPVLQQTGRDSTSYTLTARLHPALGTPMAIIKQLEAAGDTGEVMVLQTAVGEQLGSYVLTGLDRRPIRTTPKGELLICEIDIKLKEHRFIDVEFIDGIAVEGTATDEGFSPVAVDDSRNPDDVTLAEIVRSG